MNIKTHPKHIWYNCQGHKGTSEMRALTKRIAPNPSSASAKNKICVANLT